MDTNEEITLIRERLARIEAQLVNVQRAIEASPPKSSVVIPVAVVVVIVQAASQLVQHFT
jgi:DNA-binding FrmR family transcriptional regulator